MVIGGSSKSKETKNKRSRNQNDNNTLPSPSKSKPSDSKLGRRVEAFYCHQCRQKGNGFRVTCKSQYRDKPCVLRFCEKCLLRCYGGKAQNIALLDDWTCPRCKGICICTKCRNKQREKPFAHAVKSAGFDFVSEMTTRVKRKMPIGSNVGIRVSPRTRRKMESFDENDDSTTKYSTSRLGSNDENIAKKPKIEGLEEVSNDNKDGVCSDQRSPVRPGVSEAVSEKEKETNGERVICVSSDEIEHTKRYSNEVSLCPITPKENEKEKDIGENQDVGVLEFAWEGDNVNANANSDSKSYVEETDNDCEVEIPQPQGNIFRQNIVKFFRWFVGSN